MLISPVTGFIRSPVAAGALGALAIAATVESPSGLRAARRLTFRITIRGRYGSRKSGPPSVIVRTKLEAEGWSVNEFATKPGISRNMVSRLLNGRCGMSPAMALALESIEWSDADFWMRLQSNYGFAKARRELDAETVVRN